MSDELDLDFTKSARKAASAEAVAKAEKEATTGTPELAKTGFYISKARLNHGPIVPRNGSRHGIFVIEDDRDLAKLVGEVLATAGFLTRFARNKTEINAEFNRPPLPDLVLLDVSLPDADGFAILERIRANAALTRVPVIMMTGRSDPADIAKGLTLGADGYVTKPFKISGLVSAINTVLGKTA
jgi:two-component system, OmpR family, response regulator